MGRKKKQGKSRNKVRSAAAAAVSSDATANEPAYTIGKGASSAPSQAGAGGRGNAVHPFASRPNRSVGGTLVSASGKGSPGPHHHHASCGLAHNTSTPLHMAVRGDHVDVAKLLVDRGADVFALDEMLRKPLDLATSRDMKRLLRKAEEHQAAGKQPPSVPLPQPRPKALSPSPPSPPPASVMSPPSAPSSAHIVNSPGLTPSSLYGGLDPTKLDIAAQAPDLMSRLHRERATEFLTLCCEGKAEGIARMLDGTRPRFGGSGGSGGSCTSSDSSAYAALGQLPPMVTNASASSSERDGSDGRESGGSLSVLHERMLRRRDNVFDIDVTRNDGKTGLYYACEFRRRRAVYELLARGADVNFRERCEATNYTPLIALVAGEGRYRGLAKRGIQGIRLRGRLSERMKRLCVAHPSGTAPSTGVALPFFSYPPGRGGRNEAAMSNGEDANAGIPSDQIKSIRSKLLDYVQRSDLRKREGTELTSEEKEEQIRDMKKLREIYDEHRRRRGEHEDQLSQIAEEADPSSPTRRSDALSFASLRELHQESDGLEILRLMIEAGVDVSRRDAFGESSALCFAASNGEEELFRRLYSLTLRDKKRARCRMIKQEHRRRLWKNMDDEKKRAEVDVCETNETKEASGTGMREGEEPEEHDVLCSHDEASENFPSDAELDDVEDLLDNLDDDDLLYDWRLGDNGCPDSDLEENGEVKESDEMQQKRPQVPVIDINDKFLLVRALRSGCIGTVTFLLEDWNARLFCNSECCLLEDEDWWDSESNNCRDPLVRALQETGALHTIARISSEFESEDREKKVATSPHGNNSSVPFSSVTNILSGSVRNLSSSSASAAASSSVPDSFSNVVVTIDGVSCSPIEFLIIDLLSLILLFAASPYRNSVSQIQLLWRHLLVADSDDTLGDSVCSALAKRGRTAVLKWLWEGKMVSRVVDELQERQNEADDGKNTGISRSRMSSIIIEPLKESVKMPGVLASAIKGGHSETVKWLIHHTSCSFELKPPPRVLRHQDSSGSEDGGFSLSDERSTSRNTNVPLSNGGWRRRERLSGESNFDINVIHMLAQREVGDSQGIFALLANIAPQKCGKYALCVDGNQRSALHIAAREGGGRRAMVFLLSCCKAHFERLALQGNLHLPYTSPLSTLGIEKLKERLQPQQLEDVKRILVRYHLARALMSPDRDGFSPLMIACLRGHYPIVSLFMSEIGRDIEPVNPGLKTMNTHSFNILRMLSISMDYLRILCMKGGSPLVLEEIYRYFPSLTTPVARPGDFDNETSAAAGRCYDLTTPRCLISSDNGMVMSELTAKPDTQQRFPNTIFEYRAPRHQPRPPSSASASPVGGRSVSLSDANGKRSFSSSSVLSLPSIIISDEIELTTMSLMARHVERTHNMSCDEFQRTLLKTFYNAIEGGEIIEKPEEGNSTFMGYNIDDLLTFSCTCCGDRNLIFALVIDHCQRMHGWTGHPPAPSHSRGIARLMGMLSLPELCKRLMVSRINLLELASAAGDDVVLGKLFEKLYQHPWDDVASPSKLGESDSNTLNLLLSRYLLPSAIKGQNFSVVEGLLKLRTDFLGRSDVVEQLDLEEAELRCASERAIISTYGSVGVEAILQYYTTLQMLPDDDDMILFAEMSPYELYHAVEAMDRLVSTPPVSSTSNEIAGGGADSEPMSSCLRAAARAHPFIGGFNFPGRWLIRCMVYCITTDALEPLQALMRLYTSKFESRERNDEEGLRDVASTLGWYVSLFRLALISGSQQVVSFFFSCFARFESSVVLKELRACDETRRNVVHLAVLSRRVGCFSRLHEGFYGISGGAATWASLVVQPDQDGLVPLLLLVSVCYVQRRQTEGGRKDGTAWNDVWASDPRGEGIDGKPMTSCEEIAINLLQHCQDYVKDCMPAALLDLKEVSPNCSASFPLFHGAVFLGWQSLVCRIMELFQDAEWGMPSLLNSAVSPLLSACDDRFHDMVMQTPETPARDIRLVTMIACPCTSSSCSPLQIAVSEGYAAIVRDMIACTMVSIWRLERLHNSQQSPQTTRKENVSMRLLRASVCDALCSSIASNNWRMMVFILDLSLRYGLWRDDGSDDDVNCETAVPEGTATSCHYQDDGASVGRSKARMPVSAGVLTPIFYGDEHPGQAYGDDGIHSLWLLVNRLIRHSVVCDNPTCLNILFARYRLRYCFGFMNWGVPTTEEASQDDKSKNSNGKDPDKLINKFSMTEGGEVRFTCRNSEALKMVRRIQEMCIRNMKGRCLRAILDWMVGVLSVPRGVVHPHHWGDRWQMIRPSQKEGGQEEGDATDTKTVAGPVRHLEVLPPPGPGLNPLDAGRVKLQLNYSSSTTRVSSSSVSSIGSSLKTSSSSSLESSPNTLESTYLFRDGDSCREGYIQHNNSKAGDRVHSNETSKLMKCARSIFFRRRGATLRDKAVCPCICGKRDRNADDDAADESGAVTEEETRSGNSKKTDEDFGFKMEKLMAKGARGCCCACDEWESLKLPSGLPSFVYVPLPNSIRHTVTLDDSNADGAEDFGKNSTSKTTGVLPGSSREDHNEFGLIGRMDEEGRLSGLAIRVKEMQQNVLFGFPGKGSAKADQDDALEELPIPGTYAEKAGIHHLVTEKLSFHSAFVSGSDEGMTDSEDEVTDEEITGTDGEGSDGLPAGVDDDVALHHSTKGREMAKQEGGDGILTNPSPPHQMPANEGNQPSHPPPHPFLREVITLSARCPSSVVLLSELEDKQKDRSHPSSSVPTSEAPLSGKAGETEIAGVSWLPMESLWGMMRCGDPRKMPQAIEIISSRPELLKCVHGPDEETLLHAAVEGGNLSFVKLLLLYGANVCTRTRERLSVLHIACWYGHHAVLMKLLQHACQLPAARLVMRGDGSESSTASCHPETILPKNRNNILNLVTDADEDNVGDFSASSENREPIVLPCHLLQWVNGENEMGETAMMLAAMRGHDRCLALMLQVSDPNLRDKKGNTALHHAAQWQAMTSIRILLAAGASVFFTNDDGDTPIGVAMSVEDEKVRIGEKALDRKSTRRYRFAQEILLLCERRRWFETRKIRGGNQGSGELKQQWFSLYQRTNMRADKGDQESSHETPKGMPGYDSLDSREEHVPIDATKSDDSDGCVQPSDDPSDGSDSSIAAEEEVVDEEGEQDSDEASPSTSPTPVRSTTATARPHLDDILLTACRRGDLKSVTICLKSGANANTICEEDPKNTRRRTDPMPVNMRLGKTPLHIVASAGHAELIPPLVQHGAELECRDVSDRWTPLHCAAEANNVQCCEELIREGVSIDSRDAADMTPLHWAVLVGNDQVVALLLRNGADPHALDLHGKRPIDKAFGDDDVCELLQTYMRGNGELIKTKLLPKEENNEVSADNMGSAGDSNAEEQTEAETLGKREAREVEETVHVLDTSADEMGSRGRKRSREQQSPDDSLLLQSMSSSSPGNSSSSSAAGNRTFQSPFKFNRESALEQIHSAASQFADPSNLLKADNSLTQTVHSNLLTVAKLLKEAPRDLPPKSGGESTGQVPSSTLSAGRVPVPSQVAKSLENIAERMQDGDLTEEAMIALMGSALMALNPDMQSLEPDSTSHTSGSDDASTDYDQE